MKKMFVGTLLAILLLTAPGLTETSTAKAANITINLIEEDLPHQH